MNQILLLICAMTFSIATLAAPSVRATATSCDQIFVSDDETIITNPERWMQDRIATTGELTYEEALKFAVSVLPEGAERNSFRSMIEAEITDRDVRITNTSQWSSVRRSHLVPKNVWRRRPQVKWIMRKISNRDEFLDVVTHAIRLTSTRYVDAILDRNIYRTTPSRQTSDLANAASEIISWEAAVASHEAFDPSWVPPSPTWKRFLTTPAVRGLSVLTLGFAFEADLADRSLFRVNPDQWATAKARDKQALARSIYARHGWKQYLRWYRSHLANVAKAILLSAVVVFGPEITQTSWHQYQIEHTAIDLKLSDSNVTEAKRLSSLPDIELMTEFRKKTEAIQSSSEPTDLAIARALNDALNPGH